MTTEPRTRTPRLHAYLITVTNPNGHDVDVLVEAHSITEARAWFIDNFIAVIKPDPRELHTQGALSTPFYNAYEPLTVEYNIPPRLDDLADLIDAIPSGPRDYAAPLPWPVPQPAITLAPDDTP